MFPSTNWVQLLVQVVLKKIKCYSSAFIVFCCREKCLVVHCVQAFWKSKTLRRQTYHHSMLFAFFLLYLSMHDWWTRNDDFGNQINNYRDICFDSEICIEVFQLNYWYLIGEKLVCNCYIRVGHLSWILVLLWIILESLGKLRY